MKNDNRMATSAGAPFPSRRPPPKSCAHLAGTLSYRVGAYAYTSSESMHTRGASTSPPRPGQEESETHRVYLPRCAIGHVLEAPIAHPQDAARIIAVDRAREEIHRTSVSESILAFSVRERVGREVPRAEGRDAWSCEPKRPPPRQGEQTRNESTAPTRF
jgi:hypothetical protein